MSVWSQIKKMLIFASLISPSKIILFEKWYQVFHHQINHLEVLQKHSAARVVFSMRLLSMFFIWWRNKEGGGVAWMKHCFLWLIYYISNRPDVICIGDINCDLLHPVYNGKQGRELFDICDVYDLHNLINEPTRIFSTKESCLDVLSTNVPSLALKSGTVDIGLSDHMLICTILNKKLVKPKARFIKERFFNMFQRI